MGLAGIFSGSKVVFSAEVVPCPLQSPPYNTSELSMTNLIKDRQEKEAFQLVVRLLRRGHVTFKKYRRTGKFSKELGSGINIMTKSYLV